MSGAQEVLLVDDEPDFLETTNRRLTRRGYTVWTARDCHEAMAVIKAHPPGVVILDLMLPECGGKVCLQRIKRAWPALPVIFLTGHASLQEAMDCLDQGAADYCLKPLELEDLLDKIQIVCRQ